MKRYLIIVAVFAFIFGMIFEYFFSPLWTMETLDSNKAYVYVDAERVIRHVVDELQKNNTSDDEMEKAVQDSRSKFAQELKDYSQSHNAIIFSSPKALEGAEDVTEYFIERLP